MNSIPEHASGDSVDAREVAYYDSLAATWWDQSGPFWPLHRLNILRTQWLVARMAEHFGRDATSDAPLAGLRVIDVGCGGGILAESMAAHGAEVTGIDVVTKNIAIAQSHASKSNLNITYRCMTAEDLAETDERFDVVLNMEVVEHVADLPGFMQACTRLVGTGGMMFVATLNRTPKSWLFGIVGAEYVMRWLPRGTHRWGLFRTPTELGELMALDGLQVVAETGVQVNPITRRFSLCGSKQVNYMLAASR
ncbi:MAG: bifunctional 2-polyprenyl-6-hydroxyphenol methylase/3-demethylubiquinol 3-O-methyltransferase UbiG [Gammaproteobacteria bacterium]